MLLEWLFGPRVEHIDGPELARRLKQGDAPLVLDVRMPSEFRERHIPGALHIPLGQLAKRLDEIPRDREVVTVCRSGHRSLVAAQMLAKQGCRVKNLAGGMQFWAGRTTR